MMRAKIQWIGLLSLSLVSLSAQARNLIPELSQKGATRWQPPPIAVHILPNGLQLYLLEDHQLPLFEAKLFVKGGDVYEPVQLAGLADITADLLATGGTKSKTPMEVDEWLDERAIHLSGEAGKETTTLTISSLSKQWREALDFLGEVVKNPRWDKERFLLATSRYKENLRRDEDEPETVARRTFRQTIYGENHPWGKIPTLRSIQRIQIEDMESFYTKYFHPNRMILAVAGDFSSAAVKKWFEAWGGSLPQASAQEPLFERLPFVNKSVTIQIKRKVNQAYIEVGHLGLERFAQEEYAYALLQYILGGEPFTSRLGADIRSERGLAYSVYSDSELNPVRGFFTIHVQTRAEAQETVLERIHKHLEELAIGQNITAEELKMAKEALLNKYIFLFDSPFDFVFTRAKYDLLGFQPDYLIKYPDRLKRVTLKEILNVASGFIQPEGLKVVIVGP